MDLKDRDITFERDLMNFFNENNIDKKNVLICTSDPYDNSVERNPLVKEIVCWICKTIIRKGIWTGTQWVWEEYTHICSGSYDYPNIQIETVTCPSCGLVLEAHNFYRCPSCLTVLPH